MNTALNDFIYKGFFGSEPVSWVQRAHHSTTGYARDLLVVDQERICQDQGRDNIALTIHVLCRADFGVISSACFSK